MVAGEWLDLAKTLAIASLTLSLRQFLSGDVSGCAVRYLKITGSGGKLNGVTARAIHIPYFKIVKEIHYGTIRIAPKGCLLLTFSIKKKP
jgi:hypothetical protein